MTELLIVLKVFPEGDEVSLDKIYNEIASKLPEGYKIVKKETEPIAYGLNSLVLYVQMPEQTEGGTDLLEETANSIEGVSHAEVVGMTRLGF